MSRSISKAVKVSAEWHHRLRVEAAKRDQPIQGLLQDILRTHWTEPQTPATGPVTTAKGSLNEEWDECVHNHDEDSA